VEDGIQVSDGQPTDSSSEEGDSGASVASSKSTCPSRACDDTEFGGSASKRALQKVEPLLAGLKQMSCNTDAELNLAISEI